MVKSSLTIISPQSKLQLAQQGVHTKKHSEIEFFEKEKEKERWKDESRTPQKTFASFNLFNHRLNPTSSENGNQWLWGYSEGSDD